MYRGLGRSTNKKGDEKAGAIEVPEGKWLATSNACYSSRQGVKIDFKNI